MDGLGNDFGIFDQRKKPISISKDQIIKISNRNNESIIDKIETRYFILLILFLNNLQPFCDQSHLDD